MSDKIDYTFIHNAVCSIGDVLGGALSEQQHHDIEHICQDIARNEHASEWIDINDACPEMNQLVIVGNAMCEAPWISVRRLGKCDKDIDPVGRWYHQNDHYDSLPFLDVTHWRYMPDPPTQGPKISTSDDPDHPDMVQVKKDGVVIGRVARFNNGLDKDGYPLPLEF